MPDTGKWSSLGALPVVEDGPPVKKYRKAHDGQDLALDVSQPAPLKDHHPHDFNEIGNRVEPGNDLGPWRHTLYGGKQPAH